MTQIQPISELFVRVNNLKADSEAAGARHKG